MKNPTKIAIAGHTQRWGDREIEVDYGEALKIKESINYEVPRLCEIKGGYKGFIPNNPKRRRK